VGLHLLRSRRGECRLRLARHFHKRINIGCIERVRECDWLDILEREVKLEEADSIEVFATLHRHAAEIWLVIPAVVRVPREEDDGSHGLVLAHGSENNLPKNCKYSVSGFGSEGLCGL
jgi:hypothetical protein